MRPYKLIVITALAFFYFAACFDVQDKNTSGEPDRIITAKDFVKDMGLGFNIGNSLDSWGGETAWGNVAVNQAFIKALKNYGYKTVRLPVTWADKMGPSPHYLIA